MNCQLTTAVTSLMTISGVAAGTLAAVTPVNPGQTVALSGITHAEDPSLGATVLLDWVQEFSISNATGELYRASLQSRVARRHDTNELDFYWRVRDVEIAQGEISSIVVTGFDGFLQGVEYRPDGQGDIGASHASRSADGLALGYLFANPTLSGQFESKASLARTDAFEYDTVGTVRINLLSGEFITLSTLAPVVPAPGGAALLAGAGLLAARRRRA